MPSAVFSAGGQEVEPTLPAAEMTDGEEAGGEGEAPGAAEEPSEATEEIQQTPEEDTSSSFEDAQETVQSQDAVSAAAAENIAASETAAKVMTTVNTAGKRWVVPRGNKGLSLTLCYNADGTLFDLTAQAGQKLYGYDTLQGATAGKGYGYFTLYNRKNNHVKIVKVRLTDMVVIKVSAALKIHHANEITYNGKKNIIVVANSTPKPKRLSVINADTLQIMYNKTLKLPRKVKGMSKKQRKQFKGVGAIAYNEKHNLYVCRMRKTHDLLFLKANLKPYKRVKLKSKLSLLYQGLDSYQDCIMVCQSFKGKKMQNVVTVYNMKGKKIARFKMAAGKPALELQTVFHDGNQFYAGFYSFYGTKSDSVKLHVKRDNRIYRINNL